MKDSIRFKLESGEKESPLLTVFHSIGNCFGF